MILEIETPEAMETLGRRLAALLRPGDILSLNGSLGAGKTLLVSGIAQALGVEVQITSPTFLVVRSYDEGLLPLTHVDVYRLGSTAEFTDLELIPTTRDGVLAIEWGDAVRAALPADVLSIEIQADADGVRTVAFRPEGQWGSRSLQELDV